MKIKVSMGKKKEKWIPFDKVMERPFFESSNDVMKHYATDTENGFVAQIEDRHSFWPKHVGR